MIFFAQLSLNPLKVSGEPAEPHTSNGQAVPGIPHVQGTPSHHHRHASLSLSGFGNIFRNGYLERYFEAAPAARE